MPSASDRFAWLRSQGLGLVCGYGTVLLLAVGSVVLTATRDGASAGVGLDDLTAFFARPAWAHLWLYALVPLTALYVVNTTLATWETVKRRWRAGVRTPAAYAGSVMHASFLLALVAHLVGGFLGRDGDPVVVASGWRPVPGFGEARLVKLEVETLPGGMPREARVDLEVRGPDGQVRLERVGYNQPLSGGLGARLALLGEYGQVWVAHLASGEERCAAVEGQACTLGGWPVQVLAAGRAPGVLVRAPAPPGFPEERWLTLDGEVALRGGRPLQLARAGVEQAVLLRVRATPGHPWALAASALLALGVLMMWRRLTPRAALPVD